MTSSDTADYMLIKEFADKALEMYRLNKINSINVIYTCFVNNINFKATVFSVLPGEKKEDEKKISASVNKFCDTVAKVLLDSMDMLNNMILSMTNLGASNDQIIKTISTILKNHFNN